MIPPNALVKLRRRLRYIQKWRYAAVAAVPLEMTAMMKEHLRKPPAEMAYTPVAEGDTFGAHWHTVWFRGDIEVPSACAGKRVYYRHDSAAEKLLFVDGAPYAGVDANHVEILLVDGAKGGETFHVDVEAYCGHMLVDTDCYIDRDHTFHTTCSDEHEDPPLKLRKSELVVEREAMAALCYEASVLYETALILDENSRRRAELLDAVNVALDKVPMHWTEEELEAGCIAAREILAPELAKTNSVSAPNVGIVGHAHIDIAWLWTMQESIRKGARTFSTVLRLMEDYPEFLFLQSQPVTYQFMEDHYPEILEQIKERVKEGRWQPNGGMWVEADCNVSGGEALVRQFLEGGKKLQELFGYVSDTLWLPDVFGYAAALPQILKRSGIVNFVTSKLNWNDTNRFPYDQFWWRGIDGTEIFTHFLTGRIEGYNGNVTPKDVFDPWSHVQQKECQDSVLQPMGWGDGGGGPTREMMERARRMKDLEGLPKTDWINVSEFLARMREQAIKRPRWVGELYLELHRGTYTAEARTKKYNRKLELLLREVELYAAMAMPQGFEYPAEALQRNWRVVLTNQFHDILPGSSIYEVYVQAEKEYAQVEKELLQLREAALTSLSTDAGDGSQWLLCNALSWQLDEIVVLDVPEGLGAVDAVGNTLPAQRVENGLAVQTTMESLSVTPVTVTEQALDATSAFLYQEGRLETPLYTVMFDDAGKITGLFDKAAQREVVQEGRRLNDFYTAEDFPIRHDSWDIVLDYRDQIVVEDCMESREVIADGPLLFTLRSVYKIGRASTMLQDMTFYADSRRIDFDTDIDWQEDHTLLKTGFAVDVHAETYRNEIQYGHAVRNMHSNTSWDQAQFEVCAHKWVDVSEGDYGVAILNDCKYGHDSLDDMISLTLLTASRAPNTKADIGRHTFKYAILPHEDDFNVETVVRESYALNIPVTTQPGVALAQRLCTVSNPNVIIEAVKKAEDEDAIIIRCYEAGKSRGPVTFTFDRPVANIGECNLMEVWEEALEVEGNAVMLQIKPFQIRTLKVYF